MTDTVRVELGHRSYDIVIGEGVLCAGVLDDIIDARRVLVVTNDVVAPLWLERLRSAMPASDVVVHTLRDGEVHKRLDAVASIIDTALDAGLARDCVFVALGGGVVGDITGFAAACYMRGVEFVQVPTTLLAQVDSSVGGKTGVNHPRGKNLIGAFHQPQRVVIDVGTLKTLPAREFSAGMAEVIKHGAISDVDYFTTLERDMDALMRQDSAALTKAIATSCRIKAAVVAQDEREQGLRAILNFGHTFGHAVEACTGYTRFLHGEAVAIGMHLAAQMSDIDDADRVRLKSLLQRANLPVRCDGVSPQSLLEAMGHDKKVLRGTIRLVLLRQLGSAFVTADYDPARLQDVLAGIDD
ncbi:MAG: 3-dehydroquinate synthase [Pseudomonadota bacterium]